MDKIGVKPRIYIGKHLTYYKYLCHIKDSDKESTSYSERNALGVGMTMREAYEDWVKRVVMIDNTLTAIDSILKRENK